MSDLLDPRMVAHLRAVRDADVKEHFAAMETQPVIALPKRDAPLLWAHGMPLPTFDDFSDCVTYATLLGEWLDRAKWHRQFYRAPRLTEHVNFGAPLAIQTQWFIPDHRWGTVNLPRMLWSGLDELLAACDIPPCLVMHVGDVEPTRAVTCAGGWSIEIRHYVPAGRRIA